MGPHRTPHALAGDLLQHILQYMSAQKIPEDFDKAVDILQRTQGRILLSGIGKSGYIAQKIHATLLSLCIPSAFLHTGEALHGDLGMVQPSDTLLMFSHSGLSAENMTVWLHVLRYNIPRILITSNLTTPMARSADALLHYTPDELCMWQRVPTLSAQWMLVLGDLLCMVLQRCAGLQEEDFLACHPAGAHGHDAQQIDHIYAPLSAIPQVHEAASIYTAIQKIQEYQKGYALILDDHDHLRGIFTDGDLRRALLQHADIHSAIMPWTTLAPITLQLGMTVAHVRKLFHQHKITAAPVCDHHNHVIGMIDHHNLECVL